MIPIRIALTNFGPWHGTTTVDFTGIHMAVITGPDGSNNEKVGQTVGIG